MKNRHHLFLWGILAILSTSCKHNLSPEVIKNSKTFDDYWNKLDSTSRADLAKQVYRKEQEAFLASNRFQERNGRGISATEADRYTANYYAQFTTAQAIDTATKSVHFDIAELEDYIRIIRSKCPNTNCRPGIRIYFSQYDNDIDEDDLKGRTSVILRGTINYKDLAHDPDDDTNQNYVAWNYGDPCPPRCDKNENGTIQRCSDGRYQSGGHARTSACDR